MNPRMATALVMSAATALVFSGCSVSEDGPLSGPAVSAEKCLGMALPEHRVVYTTNLELDADVPEATLLKVNFTEPKNIELLASSITPRTEVVPVGIGYAEDADRDWPEWKDRLPAESGTIATPVTLLVIEARQIDPALEDATATGLDIEYEVDGKRYRASSTLAFRIAAGSC